MHIKQLIETFEGAQLPSQADAIATINQADSIKDLKSLCELTEDGGVDGLFADLHIRALRRFVEVSPHSDIDAHFVAWMAGMHGRNVKDEKKAIFREACDKGGTFTEVYLKPDCDDVGNLSLSADGDIELICREGDWVMSLKDILGEPMDVKSVVLSDEWDIEDSRIAEFLKKLSDNYLPALEDITIFNVNDERFQEWTKAFRNVDLLSGTKNLKRLFVESDGEFVPPLGATKIEGRESWWVENATFIYEEDALKRLLAVDQEP